MGFSSECIQFLSGVHGDVNAELTAAQALVPSAVVDSSGLADELRACAADSYFHFWMDNLQQLGVHADETGRALPAKYWEHLARAAALMEFDPFVPFLFGKARGKPARSWPDAMAGLVVLHASAPQAIWDDAPRLRPAFGEVVKYLAQLDPSHEAAFATGDLQRIAGQLARFEKFNDPAAGVFPEFMRRFDAIFDPLFAVVMDERLPPSLEDAAWSVIAVCTFAVVLAGGTMTEAAPWWRRR